MQHNSLMCVSFQGCCAPAGKASPGGQRQLNNGRHMYAEYGRSPANQARSMEWCESIQSEQTLPGALLHACHPLPMMHDSLFRIPSKMLFQGTVLYCKMMLHAVWSSCNTAACSCCLHLRSCRYFPQLNFDGGLRQTPECSSVQPIQELSSQTLCARRLAGCSTCTVSC